MSRVDAPNLTPYKPHPNTWLLTTDLFYRIGGYDERFSGFYGTDGEFRNRVQRTADEIGVKRRALLKALRSAIGGK